MTDMTELSTDTAVHLLDSLASSPAHVFFPESGQQTAHTALPELAWGVAAALAADDTRRGSTIGILTGTEPDFLPAILGSLAAGIPASVLPVPPVLLDPRHTAEALSAIVDAARMSTVLASTALVPTALELQALRPAIQVIDISRLGPRSRPDHPPMLRDREPAIIQFTSGSTSAPKGVVISHSAFLAGVHAIASRLRMTSDDVGVQWVPLFHDMGLVSLFVSLAVSGDAHLFTPLSFVRRPEYFLEHMARVGGTVTNGPNFGYERLIAALPKTRLPASLSRWRLAINGGEVVGPATIGRFRDAFASVGVPSTTMFPSYGMAEATLAITMPHPGEEPSVLHIDRGHLTPGREICPAGPDDECAMPVVCLGRPLRGLRLRIVHDGNRLPDGHLGDIQVRGASLTSGYLHNDEATDKAFTDGWFDTGDLGFLHGGQLYVTGRRKELIVVRGRNFFPDDVEALARDVPGVYRRHAVAFADAEGEQIIVVAEQGVRNRQDLVDAVEKAVTDRLGLTACRTILVPPNTLPRTTSGKWQRTRIRARFIDHRAAEHH
ncbi:AMP-binding protein [Nocardia grenadensis]|uniref:AMP-binding protein n=1 Tax=Nocardia grenadensis TaxID=931537 RepID=UPI003D8F757F